MNKLLPSIFSLRCPSSFPTFHQCVRQRSTSTHNSGRLPPFCRWAPPSSRRRRRRDARRLGNPPPSVSEEEGRVKMVIDVGEAKARVSNAVEDFLTAGEEAIRDLQSLVSFDRDGRVIVVACRRSSLEFLGAVLLCSLCLLAVGRALVRLAMDFGGGKFRGGLGSGVVVRRDRSLGGKEVVVGTRSEWEVGRNRIDFNANNPLSSVRSARLEKGEREKRAPKVESLPGWWPDMEFSRAKQVVEPEFQREANRIVRAIMNNRLAGRDITDEDVIQLRRVCRAGGAKVSFDTLNTRDSFFRASVNFVLDVCCSTWDKAMVQVDGEEAPRFLAGLADNIGLEDTRASNIVSAAVAARTRSLLLQAWALEMQGERSASLQELQKLCVILQTFLPDEHSPEMEMVARGFEKHLKLEQREKLFNLYIGVCSTQSRRIAAEALGLV